MCLNDDLNKGGITLIMVSFLENNQETFNILLSFLVMSKGFKFAFAEINFPPDIDELITALQFHEKCQNLQLVVLKLDDPDLHFLLETLKQHLLTLKLEPEKKLVLILRGLEKAIGTSGNNPAILTNLNYARDSFPKFTPHPILFILPDYAVTRFAKFAPDFWAWTSANFRFQTVPEVRQNLLENAFHPINSNRTYAKVTKSENIELLTRLLQEYTEETEASQRTRIELLQQLGKEHQSVREFTAAKEYLQEALMLCRELQYQSGEAEVLHDLGEIFCRNREFKQSRVFLQQSLAIYQIIDNKENQASIYHLLGNVALELREYEEARNNYQQAIAICVEFGDRYSQAMTYHCLGMVAQELREYEEARKNYQQALAIKVEFGDRYFSASTYHQLGIVAEELREYEEARNNYQQALAIFVEFGDRYNQANTYHQLGSVAEDLEEFQEAKTNFLQALSIYAEFNDQYSLETFSIPALKRLYQATQDPSILETLAQLFGTTVDQIATLFEDN
jgi:tetratricopeptide (TPR) repeat protein